MFARSCIGWFTALILAAPQGGPSVTVTASPGVFVEGSTATVDLVAQYTGSPLSHAWGQIAGPRVPLVDLGPNQAAADVSALQVAADVQLVFELRVTTPQGTGTGRAAVHVRPADRVPVLGANIQVGGATTAVVSFEHDGAQWALFNVGARLSATPASAPQGAVHSIHLAGFIRDVKLVDHGGKRYALVATGEEGIAIVDLDDPTAMKWLGSVRVNYYKDKLTWTEGGGAILVNQVIAGTKGTVATLVTDGTTLWIANADYGLHRTALANLLATGGPVTEPDGTLLIEHEAYLLQYAGETPWGAPLGMELRDGRLFVAQQFLGLTILDAYTLRRVGGYNMYTDLSMLEDWFIDMDVSKVVQPGFLDPVTGMPDYRQASWEIENSHGTGQQSGNQGLDINTPWADFEKYGKYYYQAQDVALARFGGQMIAYIAYGMGGLVAVDVSGFETATPDRFLLAEYLGYAPAVPAHGSDEFIGEHFTNIFPRFGSGMLKEAGVVDVSIHGRNVYYTDHFAGLVVLGGASLPHLYWQGVGAPFDNDENGIPGDHEPDYEFVTSYDMSPYDPTDHESLPTWMYKRPSLMVTGEIGGHGNSLELMGTLAHHLPGNVDALVCLGAGGLAFVDIHGLRAPQVEDRFDMVGYFPTTDEIGAAPDGSPTQSIAIGHTQGIDASETYLYVADGPHGVSAWKLVDEQGFPRDDVHLVANTVQDEYPVTVGSTTIYPATHAYGVVFDPVAQAALTLCQGVGLRRVPTQGVEAGIGLIGSPLLLTPQPEDIFEHNGAAGKVHSVPKQDHTYDVALDGNLAFVADGGNGLTIYDLTRDPTVIDGGFFVANLGGASKQRPLLGRATGIALWTDPSDGAKYALTASGPYGVGVSDVSDPANPELVKIFEPYKLEDGKVGKADGRCVDVFVHAGHAYFTYDGFGVLSFDLDDLVAPLPPGVSPTQIWKSQGGVVLYDHRPRTKAEFRLREDPIYGDWGGGALNMTHTTVGGELVLYVGYAQAGVVVLQWPDPASPILDEVIPTVGECSAVTLSGGRLYAADGNGGMVYFK